MLFNQLSLYIHHFNLYSFNTYVEYVYKFINFKMNVFYLEALCFFFKNTMFLVKFKFIFYYKKVFFVFSQNSKNLESMIFSTKNFTDLMQ